MVGQIKMKLGMQVGLGSGHIVLGGDPAPTYLKGHSPRPQFSAHICCSQMAAWIKMSLGMELGLKNMGGKLGPLSLFSRVELGPHLTQCGQGRGLPAGQVSS